MKSAILLLIFIFLTLLFYDFYQYFGIRFEGWHIWRQADCLAITNSYFHFDPPFFEPRMYNLGQSGNGRATSDFPLMYYCISTFSGLKNFELIYKLIIFLISTSGLFALFSILNRYISSWQAGLCTMLFLCSPTYVFYSNNYLMNAPAFSISIIGVALYLHSRERERILITICSLLFIAIGALLKITAFSHILVLIFLIVVSNYFRVIEISKIDKVFLIGCVPVGISIISWYTYASNYNEVNNSGMFLTGILPIWSIQSKAEIFKLFDEIWFRRRLLYSSEILSLALFALCIAFFFVWSQKPKIKVAALGVIVYFTGFIVYFLLFYQVLNHHDYYFFNWLILIPLATAFLFYSLKDYKNYQWAILLIIGVLFIDGIFTCELRIRERYTGWRNRFYREYVAKLESDTQNYFSEFIDIDSKVLVPSDPTINTSLVTLNSQGWTGYNLERFNIESIIDKEVELLVLLHNEKLQEDITKYFNLKTPIVMGDYSGVYGRN